MVISSHCLVILAGDSFKNFCGFPLINQPLITSHCCTLAPMIAHLRGTLLAKHPNQAIVETHGVGYDVVITVPTYSELAATGSEVALHIHTHVREDALSLYGFLRLTEKHLF